MRIKSAQALPRTPDPAILRLARALALQAAREDHDKEMAAHGELDDETCRNLRALLD